jgi:hypothetical protein
MVTAVPLQVFQEVVGGRGGIRTHGTLAGTPVFKTGALNHSATLPSLEDQALSRAGLRAQRELGTNLGTTALWFEKPTRMSRPETGLRGHAYLRRARIGDAVDAGLTALLSNVTLLPHLAQGLGRPGEPR